MECPHKSSPWKAKVRVCVRVDLKPLGREGRAGLNLPYSISDGVQVESLCDLSGCGCSRQVLLIGTMLSFSSSSNSHNSCRFIIIISVHACVFTRVFIVNVLPVPSPQSVFCPHCQSHKSAETLACVLYEV